MAASEGKPESCNLPVGGRVGRHVTGSPREPCTSSCSALPLAPSPHSQSVQSSQALRPLCLCAGAASHRVCPSRVGPSAAFLGVWLPPSPTPPLLHAGETRSGRYWTNSFLGGCLGVYQVKLPFFQFQCNLPPGCEHRRDLVRAVMPNPGTRFQSQFAVACSATSMPGRRLYFETGKKIKNKKARADLTCDH